MDGEYLPEFCGVYLEDSYFMGMTCEGADLHLNVLFALTSDHSDYSPPAPGELHCYRRGRLVLSDPSVLRFSSGFTPSVMRDPDGKIDFGSIELYRRGPAAFRIVTEWFELTAEVKSLVVSIVRHAR